MKVSDSIVHNKLAHYNYCLCQIQNIDSTIIQKCMGGVSIQYINKLEECRKRLTDEKARHEEWLKNFLDYPLVTDKEVYQPLPENP